MIAAIVGCAEYWLEFATVPWFRSDAVSAVGAVLALAGDTFRKLAMHQAGSNFKHMVQEKRANDHKLVTHGVYRLARHPSYVLFHIQLTTITRPRSLDHT